MTWHLKERCYKNQTIKKVNEDQGEEQMIENKDGRTKEQTSPVKIKNN